MKYRFENCVIDVDRHQLLVNGSVRTVEPQVFALLCYMAENAGRLISQGELVSAVWRGRTVSDSAISARISAARSAIGDSGSKQAVIKTVPRCGFRFIAEVAVDDDGSAPATEQARPAGGQRNAGAQRVRFCNSRDGTRIAFATTGSGYPMVRTGHWLTHIELDWQSPLSRPLLEALGKRFCLTRYDQRGNGLSDWSVRDYSLERCVEDLEAVVDAAGVERFALYGASQGAPTAIVYAARYPQRVSHLILRGGYVCGRMLRSSAAEREEGEALLTLIRHGWGKPGSAFLKAFSSMYVPDASQEFIDSLADFQRQTAPPENVAALRAAVDRFDVSDLLTKVSVPTLVMHARHDSVQPLEQGLELAAGIRNAEFVLLESGNHILVPDEPAWEVFFDEIDAFVFKHETC